MGRQHASESTSQSPADRLAEELQSLKSASGLTYARISERTHYAKSSWERWVNGKQFPPRDAVESIASVCEGDAEQLLALWHLANTCRVTVGAPGALPDGPPDHRPPECPHHRQALILRRLVLLGLGLAAGAGLAAVGRRPLRHSV
ncbi:helix-turn-helix transcriptional regulator [Kitasatospora sp. NPDC004669]|uniref:helix-turn-helix domain-containing protein n=1 Tax=Kitasatospora sp. NPDC004669 TaxID=3154555 RepID=UPI0033BA6041